jgi:putative ABC transport system ATP-binding protein
MKCIEAKGVTKVFGDGALAYTALHDVDFSADVGELVILEGPSGSGKTTLLSILGCVLAPTAGDVCLLGTSLGSLDPRTTADVRLGRIGFVFQGHNLIASLGAAENVAYPAELAGLGRREALRRAEELLDRVGLSDKAGNTPAELSGGQRQRVAIARALVQAPPLVLADEPTASLDAESGLRVTELLRELCRERDTTAVVVTHDRRIFHLADRRVHIEDGRIADSPPKELP